MKKIINPFIIIILVLLISISIQTRGQKPIDNKFTLGSANAVFENNNLIVTTGKIERSWEWTGKGFVTVSLKNLETGKEWGKKNNQMADWELPNTPVLPKGELRSLAMKESTDENFTEPHVEIKANIRYQEALLDMNYIIWVYPSSNGLRTQIEVKALEGYDPKTPAENRWIPSEKISIIKAIDTREEKVELRDGSVFTTNAQALFDNNQQTYWQTHVHEIKPDKPAEIWLELNEDYHVNTMEILQKSDYLREGAPEKLLLYASDDTSKWGNPVAVMELSRQRLPQSVGFPSVETKYLRVVVPQTTRLNYHRWMSAIPEIRLYAEQAPYDKNLGKSVDHIPLATNKYSRRAIGYYADNQFRNSLKYPLYKEDLKTTDITHYPEVWSWNNILSIESNGEGLCMVKESNKTASQQSHYAGVYTCNHDGVMNTGWGMSPEEIITGEYRKCWASWVITYSGGDTERQLAIKQFDRKRFPLNLEGQKSSFACSWGFAINREATGRDKQDGAIEENVLKELDAAAEMGIETYLIDDGWNFDTLPNQSRDVWYPYETIYPEGWKNVKEKASELDLKLALWTTISAPLEDIVWNQERGDFVNWKWDFASFYNYESRDIVLSKARKFIKQFNYEVSLSWDLTEVYPRYGLFWAREYGTIWWANQEPYRHILYTPSVMLRDAWDLSRYLNINKFQFGIRNTERVYTPSDAYLHTNAYATATAIMGIPMFFERLQTYSKEAKKEIKATLELYKNARPELYESFVFPIGDRPNNDTFTGFQAINENGKTGHLLVFRELYCTAPSRDIQVHALKNKTLLLTNLKTNESKKIKITPEGYMNFQIDNPAEFVFLKYEIVDEE